MNIRGKSWKDADLSHQDFQQCHAGLTRVQLTIVQAILSGLVAITGFLTGASSLGATALLKPGNIEKFTLIPGVVLSAIALSGMVLVIKKGFAAFLILSASAFSLFAICFWLAEQSSPWLNLWANLFIFTAITVVPQLITLWIGGMISAADRSLSRSIWIVLSITGFAGVIGNLVLIKWIDQRVYVGWLDAAMGIALLFTCAVIGHRAVQAESSFPGIFRAAIVLTSFRGTSFQRANLTEANFAGANLKHTDFRGANLTRVCWHKARGLECSRLDNTYLANSKIRQLVITLEGQNQNFDDLNLAGVNLQDANLKHASFVSASLKGANLRDADLRKANLEQAQLDQADLRNADLRNSILVRSILTNADLTGADLTGACIKDWSFNDQTRLTNVKCEYVYREFENGQPTDQYPCDRNFKPGEFESLFQKLTNAVELVFQEQIDWRALSFTFEKFQLEDDGMGLELKGVEQRGDYWIVKITHGEDVSKQQVEQQVQNTYDELRAIMEAKDKQINRLLGIVEHQTEALTNLSKQPFGNHFLISGSTITNLAGSGQIEYREAASCVRSFLTNPTEPNLQNQLQEVAKTAATQGELIQQILLSEADRDPIFRRFLLEEGQQVMNHLPSGEFAIAIQSAISQLKN